MSSNVSFLAALLVIEPCYEYIFKLEKIAQGKFFSPFDLNHCLQELKKTLSQDLQVINPKDIALLSTGVLEYEYVHGRKVICSKVDLQEITELLQLNVISLRQQSDIIHFSPQSLINEYEKWINELERNLSQYLSLPDVSGNPGSDVRPLNGL